MQSHLIIEEMYESEEAAKAVRPSQISRSPLWDHQWLPAWAVCGPYRAPSL
jgi:hypothetical protein